MEKWVASTRMGDSFAATEPQVLDFLSRASFLNTTSLTIPQIAALGTVLISTGLDADARGERAEELSEHGHVRQIEDGWYATSGQHF